MLFPFSNMVARNILIIAVQFIVLQDVFSNKIPAPTSRKAWEGRAETGLMKLSENDSDTSEVGHIDSVGMEKSAFRQRRIHTNNPYYGGGYKYHYPQQDYGNEYGQQDYPFSGQRYGGNSLFYGYYGQPHNVYGQRNGLEILDKK
ncbi:hypothetical protein L9F63_019276 [Diploptera punctata]|uniref:Uncharacterized protein n=1 Tax=Diploptera punctata TaxID=6984 RepID=A0AAD7ZUY9_DIPPU|nr:hypothetical protein L9F63_019276 [Diploptera punctata]